MGVMLQATLILGVKLVQLYWLFVAVTTPHHTREERSVTFLVSLFRHPAP